MIYALKITVAVSLKKQQQTVPRRIGKFRIDQNSKITQTAQL